MAVRDDFQSGETLLAQDLNDTFASKLPYSYGTATPSTTDSGFLWYDSNSTPAAPKFWDGAAFQALTSGKILQVVRATDGTQRSTTSASYVDASLSVTITPQKSDSAILLIASVRAETERTDASQNSGLSAVQITDSSNNAISGAEETGVFINIASITNNKRIEGHITTIGYSTPATTSATTYKLRFRGPNGNTVVLKNSNNTAQLYALEIAA